jgi:hypothetical protein
MTLALVEDRAMPTELLDEVTELQPLVMKPEGAAKHRSTMPEREADYTFEVGHRLHAGLFVPVARCIRALLLVRGT